MKNVWTMMSVVAAVSDKSHLHVGREMDEIEVVDHMSVFVGDQSNPNDDVGKLGIDAPRSLKLRSNRRSRFERYVNLRTESQILDGDAVGGANFRGSSNRVSGEFSDGGEAALRFEFGDFFLVIIDEDLP